MSTPDIQFKFPLCRWSLFQGLPTSNLSNELEIEEITDAPSSDPHTETFICVLITQDV